MRRVHVLPNAQGRRNRGRRQATAKLVPQTQVLTGPDRLVVDFPNAVPGARTSATSP